MKTGRQKKKEKGGRKWGRRELQFWGSIHMQPSCFALSEVEGYFLHSMISKTKRYMLGVFAVLSLTSFASFHLTDWKHEWEDMPDDRGQWLFSKECYADAWWGGLVVTLGWRSQGLMGGDTWTYGGLRLLDSCSNKDFCSPWCPWPAFSVSSLMSTVWYFVWLCVCVCVCVCVNDEADLGRLERMVVSW